MAGQADAACAPSGATGLLASAISYALGACVQVAPGEMTLPTPCADWDLAALLAHLATSMADLEAAIRTGHLDVDPGKPDSPENPAPPDADDREPDRRPRCPRPPSPRPVPRPCRRSCPVPCRW